VPTYHCQYVLPRASIHPPFPVRAADTVCGILNSFGRTMQECNCAPFRSLLLPVMSDDVLDREPHPVAHPLSKPLPTSAAQATECHGSLHDAPRYQRSDNGPEFVRAPSRPVATSLQCCSATFDITHVACIPRCNKMTTRRLRARPSAVALDAIGSARPRPVTVTDCAFSPCVFK